MHRVFLQCGPETLHLDGTDPLYPLRGARLLPAAADPAEEFVREEVEYSLAGRPEVIEAACEAVGRLAARAEEGWAGGAEPLYLVCQTWPGGGAWRSRVRRAWPEALPPGAALRARGSQGAKLVLIRENGWEGPEQQAALSNGNGEGVLAPLPVLNANDGAGSAPNVRHNWVEIGAGVVGGDLPGRARVEITNLGAEPLSDVWIGQNWADPARFALIYEAESAIGEAGSPDASCSGGMQVTKTLPPGAEVDLLRWALPGEALEAGRGQRVHAVARFAQPGWETNTRLRLSLRRGGVDVWRSGWAQPRGERAMQIRDLFAFRLPDLPNPAELELVLSGAQAGAVERSLSLDFLALLPADGWRWLEFSGGGVETGGQVVDDGPAGRAWVEDEAGRALLAAARGGAIALAPMRAQRLYFFSHTLWADYAPINQALGVRVFFRNRRLGL